MPDDKDYMFVYWIRVSYRLLKRGLYFCLAWCRYCFKFLI